MNKKYIILLVVVILLLVLTISLKTVKMEQQPIPNGTYYDNINEQNIIKNDVISVTTTNSSYTLDNENSVLENNSNNLDIQFANVTFLATIEKINEYNGKTIIFAKGLEENDINFKGNFIFEIKETTEIFLNNDIAEKKDLKTGQTILIEFTGEVLESSPAQIDVTKIVIQ